MMSKRMDECCDDNVRVDNPEIRKRGRVREASSDGIGYLAHEEGEERSPVHLFNEGLAISG